MKKIAITGGIGSGKSTVCKALEKAGYPVYSCDKIYAEVLQSPTYVKQIEKLFPSAVEKGVINKKILADIVFANDTARQKLNNAAHPLIMDRLFTQMSTAKTNLVFAEVPLLFENGYEKDFDGVIVVQRKLQDRISSVRLRDGISEKEIKNRIKAQFDYDGSEEREYLKSIGAYVIENDVDLIKLNERVNAVISALQ